MRQSEGMGLPGLLSAAKDGSPTTRLTVLLAVAGARRLAAFHAGLATGLLDTLAERPATTAEAATRCGLARPDLADALLRVLAAQRLVRAGRGGWRLTRRGRSLVEDDATRALVMSGDGYHTQVYRDLPRQLRGGPDRDDLTRHAGLIAQVSRLLEPLIRDEITKVMSDLDVSSVVDLGCGSGALLRHMLNTAPQATGLGFDVAEAAVAQAVHACAEAGLGSRATLIEGDILELLPHRVPVGSADLVLATNLVYYLTRSQRVVLFSLVREALSPTGRLLIVTTDLDSSVNATHFDLLLRAQQEQVGLVPRAKLVEELAEAGLAVRRTKQLAIGEPVIALLASRPSRMSA